MHHAIIKTSHIKLQVVLVWSPRRARQVSAGGLEVDDEPPDAVVSHPVVFQGRLLAKILVQLILDLFQETGKASLVDGEGRLHCQ